MMCRIYFYGPADTGKAVDLRYYVELIEKNAEDAYVDVELSSIETDEESGEISFDFNYDYTSYYGAGDAGEELAALIGTPSDIDWCIQWNFTELDEDSEGNYYNALDEDEPVSDEEIEIADEFGITAFYNYFASTGGTLGWGIREWKLNGGDFPQNFE